MAKGLTARTAFLTLGISTYNLLQRRVSQRFKTHQTRCRIDQSCDRQRGRASLDVRTKIRCLAIAVRSRSTFDRVVGKSTVTMAACARSGEAGGLLLLAGSPAWRLPPTGWYTPCAVHPGRAGTDVGYGRQGIGGINP